MVALKSIHLVIALCFYVFFSHPAGAYQGLDPSQIEHRYEPSSLKEWLLGKEWFVIPEWLPVEATGHEPLAESLVLIHGLGSNLNEFNDVIKELRQKYRVLVYSQRGHGNTPSVGEDYSLDTLAHDLSELMIHLKIEKAHILGHSLGGRVAVKFAELFPNQTLSLIIEEQDTEKKWCQELGDQPSAHDRFRYSSMTVDLTDSLNNVPSVLLLKGKRTNTIPKSRITLIKEKFPHVKIEQIPGADHWIHTNRKEKFLEAVFSFLGNK